MQDLTEKTLATERKYTGKIISVDLVDIELPDGRKAKREVIRHSNAVAILARRPDGKFVFVKQYRKAAEEALVEVIAGGLEPGEDPIEGARRETAEETGYVAIHRRSDLDTKGTSFGEVDNGVKMLYLSAFIGAMNERSTPVNAVWLSPLNWFGGEEREAVSNLLHSSFSSRGQLMMLA